MSSRNRLVAAGSAIAVVSSIAAMAGASPAQAAWTDQALCEEFESGIVMGECYSFTRPSNGTTGLVWLGTFTGPGGWEAWCIDFLYGTDFTKPGSRQTVTSLTNSWGQSIGAPERSALAYLATKYSPTDVTDEEGAAIALIIREVMSDGYSTNSNATLFPGGLKVGQTVAAPHAALNFDAETLTIARQLWADASKYIGTWTVALSTPPSTTLSPGGTVNYTVTVKSATGVAVANEYVGVSYNNATGPATVRTNSSGQATITVKAAGSGSWGMQVTAESPGVNPEIWTPNSWAQKPFGDQTSITQRVLGTAAPKNITAAASGFTNYVASMGTTATDNADGDKWIPAAGGTVKDVVAYTGLQPGVSHTLSGVLMDKATGASTGVVATKTFTPASTDGTVSMTFAVPAAQAGKVLVAYETITNASGVEVTSHKDLNDAAQTVYVPKVTTDATDQADGDKVVAATGGTVKDVASFSGLRPGQAYTVSGELYDKATGGPTGITATRTFTPAASSGTVDLTFTVPASQAGKTLVAFETFTQAGKVVAEHRDINAASQTVSVATPTPASIGTTAVDKGDGDKFLPSAGGTLTDTVTYAGLTPGQTYTLSGALMDKASGDPTGVVASRTFTPTAATGTVNLHFTVPASQAGKVLVAFETVTNASGVEVTSHKDLNDPAQTVYVPAVGTSATDQADGDRTISATGGTVRDVVAFSGLQPGRQYTVSGVLHDKATGAATTITGSTDFTPTTADGTVAVTFTVPASMRGKTLVAFETVTVGGAPVAVHADINDASQTVSVANPSIGTTAVDKGDGDKFLPSAGGTLTDTVTYAGLTPGQTYTLSGALMDKASGDPTGVVATKAFTPTAATGTVDLDFTVPASQAGKTLVAFETVTTSSGVEVMSHKDLNDAAQTVYVPTLATSAADQGDGDKQLPASGGTVVDTVTYAGLRPGTEYTVSGELYDKASGASTGITGQTVFTPTTADGTVAVTFTVPASQAGKALVAFEQLTGAGTLIVEHKDLNDAAQTVYVPKAGTSAVDKTDSDKQVAQVGGTVADTVSFSGLVPGQAYTVTGELHDKASGEATGITGTATFTPATHEGTVVVDFTVPAAQAGRTLVAFETIKDASGAVVVEHADLDDAAQTVFVAGVKTLAVDKADGDKTISVQGGTVVDTVSYEGLLVGQEYTVNGALMDKVSGEATGITATASFTPAASSGTVKLEFTVPAGIDSTELVVFETVKLAGVTVAEHADLNDAAQTVSVDEFVPGPGPLLPATGGEGTAGALIGLGGVLAGAAAALVRWSRRSRRDSE